MFDKSTICLPKWKILPESLDLKPSHSCQKQRDKSKSSNNYVKARAGFRELVDSLSKSFGSHKHYTPQSTLGFCSFL